VIILKWSCFIIKVVEIDAEICISCHSKIIISYSWSLFIFRHIPILSLSLSLLLITSSISLLPYLSLLLCLCFLIYHFFQLLLSPQVSLLPTPPHSPNGIISVSFLTDRGIHHCQ
jgi:hypothetical protein